VTGRMSVRVVAGGVLVSVRVRPRSRPGWETADGDLLLSVKAAPVDGAATEEARRALAKALGVAPSHVSLHSGARSRMKVFAVSGIDADAVMAALERSTSR
jgi:uncharacterized protein